MTHITIPREVLEQAIEALITRNPLLCEDAITALRTALEAPAAREPIAYLCMTDEGDLEILSDKTCVACFPVYAHPAREPLTDEQIESMVVGIAIDDYSHDVVRKVEQYHGIGTPDMYRKSQKIDTF